MNDIQLFYPFLEVIYTTADAEAVQAAIDATLPEFYQVTHNDMLKGFLSHLPVDISDEFQILLERNPTIIHHVTATKSFLEGLEQALHDCQLLTLTVAFPISYETTEKVGKLLKQQFGPTALVEIHRDPTIIAGTIMTFAGKYLDYSLHTKILQSFATQTKQA